MDNNLTSDEQREMIINIFSDFADDPESLFSFIEHAGMDIRALRTPADLEDMIAGHYRLKKGAYNVEKAANDLLTWPPIARAVFARLAEREG